MSSWLGGQLFWLIFFSTCHKLNETNTHVGKQFAFHSLCFGSCPELLPWLAQGRLQTSRWNKLFLLKLLLVMVCITTIQSKRRHLTPSLVSSSGSQSLCCSHFPFPWLDLFSAIFLRPSRMRLFPWFLPPCDWLWYTGRVLICACYFSYIPECTYWLYQFNGEALKVF